MTEFVSVGSSVAPADDHAIDDSGVPGAPGPPSQTAASSSIARLIRRAFPGTVRIPVGHPTLPYYPLDHALVPSEDPDAQYMAPTISVFDNPDVWQIGNAHGNLGPASQQGSTRFPPPSGGYRRRPPGRVRWREMFGW